MIGYKTSAQESSKLELSLEVKPQKYILLKIIYLFIYVSKKEVP